MQQVGQTGIASHTEKLMLDIICAILLEYGQIYQKGESLPPRYKAYGFSASPFS
jgi:hypothetical protein